MPLVLDKIIFLIIAQPSQCLQLQFGVPPIAMWETPRGDASHVSPRRERFLPVPSVSGVIDHVSRQFRSLPRPQLTKGYMGAVFLARADDSSIVRTLHYHFCMCLHDDVSCHAEVVRSCRTPWPIFEARFWEAMRWATINIGEPTEESLQ